MYYVGGLGRAGDRNKCVCRLRTELTDHSDQSRRRFSRMLFDHYVTGSRCAFFFVRCTVFRMLRMNVRQ